MRAVGQVQSRESLTERVLGRRLTPYDRSIDTHVSNLRRKLGLGENGLPEIRSIRGAGLCAHCRRRGAPEPSRFLTAPHSCTHEIAVPPDLSRLLGGDAARAAVDCGDRLVPTAQLPVRRYGPACGRSGGASEKEGVSGLRNGSRSPSASTMDASISSSTTRESTSCSASFLSDCRSMRIASNGRPAHQGRAARS